MFNRACVVRACLALAASASAACTAGETWDQSNLDVMVPHDGFTQVNARPFASAVSGAPQVTVWIDPAGAAAYATIDPGRTGSGAQVPEGTMIVRAVLGADGQVAKLTMMTKAWPGYDDSLGDWWFAETDAAGIPLVDKGVPMVGTLAACHSCHLDRAGDDYLFGVAASDR
jgi:hypothetical protein